MKGQIRTMFVWFLLILSGTASADETSHSPGYFGNIYVGAFSALNVLLSYGESSSSVGIPKLGGDYKIVDAISIGPDFEWKRTSTLNYITVQEWLAGIHLDFSLNGVCFTDGLSISPFFRFGGYKETNGGSTISSSNQQMGMLLLYHYYIPQYVGANIIGGLGIFNRAESSCPNEFPCNYSSKELGFTPYKSGIQLELAARVGWSF